MSEEKTIVKKLSENPTSIAILILCVVILVVWVDMRSKDDSSGSVAMNSQGASMTPDSTQTDSGFQLSPQPAGRDAPSIMNMNSSENTVPGLDTLLAGLEEKVKSDPENFDNRLLLAQTYKELGASDKALSELRILQEKNPEHSRVNLVLASMLSKSENPDEVKESLTLLDRLSNDKETKQYLVNLYKGDAFMQSDKPADALKHWKQALSEMPENDKRRQMIEEKISKTNESGTNEKTPSSS